MKMKRLGWWMGAALAWSLPALAEEPVSPTFALGEVLVVGAEDAGGDGTAARVRLVSVPSIRLE